MQILHNMYYVKPLFLSDLIDFNRNIINKQDAN